MDIQDKTKEELISELQKLLQENKSLKVLKEKRAAELGIANIELDFQNDEKEKRAVELIIANKEREQVFNFFNLSPDIMVIADPNGAFKAVNPATTELLGYSEEELISKPFIDFVHPDDKLITLDEIGRQIKLGSSLNFENRYLSKNDGYLLLSWSAYFSKEEGITYATARDITNERMIEIELIEAKEKAEESDRLKSAFLANMSHEIRTPMNGILGFSDLLKTPNLSGEKQQQYIRVIEKSGARMLNIINDIISISKIESGVMEVNLEESNINEQIEYIYTFFKLEAEAKGITLSFINSLPLKEAIVKTDREKLFAILTNLVKNAIKYSEKGSIQFGYTIKGKQLEYYVKDTGIGIDKDRQEAIFERFIQADISDKNALQGAGFGLSISKAYIEMLGGKIWVESVKGKGSIFYFTLPYRTEPEEKIVVQNEEWSVKSFSKVNTEVLGLKTLVVEDDETSGKLISAIVKEHSKAVFKARTGIEAVDICRNNPDIDLILMDIQMSDLNGYEATQQIREFDKDVVIIAQTAFGLYGDKEKAIEAGCNDYISKPFNKAQLLALVQKHFKK